MKIAVYLTIDLNVKDAVFDKLPDFVKINRGDIDQKYQYDGLKNDMPTRLKNIVREIQTLNKPILVGYACYNLKELIEMNRQLEEINHTINTIFLPAEKRRKEKLKEGQKLYSQHNRWIDFYPGQVEGVYYNFEKTVSKIKAYFENSTTEVVEI